MARVPPVSRGLPTCDAGSRIETALDRLKLKNPLSLTDKG